MIRRHAVGLFLIGKNRKHCMTCAVTVNASAVNVKITFDVSSPPFLCLAASNWAVLKCSSMKCNFSSLYYIEMPLLLLQWAHTDFATIYIGNWFSPPNSWTRLMKFVENSFNIRISNERCKLCANSALQLAQTHYNTLHNTRSFIHSSAHY